jgi:hypothetical protein
LLYMDYRQPSPEEMLPVLIRGLVAWALREIITPIVREGVRQYANCL